MVIIEFRSIANRVSFIYTFLHSPLTRFFIHVMQCNEISYSVAGLLSNVFGHLRLLHSPVRLSAADKPVRQEEDHHHCIHHGDVVHIYPC